MKKFLIAILTVGLFFTIGTEKSFAQGKILIAYFSRTGNEYGLGNISKGNTKIIAEIIAEKPAALCLKLNL